MKMISCSQLWLCLSVQRSFQSSQLGLCPFVKTIVYFLQFLLLCNSYSLTFHILFLHGPGDTRTGHKVFINGVLNIGQLCGVYLLSGKRNNMGESACKCVHLASSNLPCVPVSLKAKLCGGVTLCRSNIHSNVLIFSWAEC